MFKRDIDKTQEELIDEKNSKKRTIVVLIIIIIILLLLLFFVGYRLGKIGYDCRTTPVSGDDIKAIIVSDSEKLLDKKTEIDIFSNIKFGEEHKVAPMSHGEYKFVVKNVSTQNLSYDISFIDEMTNPVNMVYKLKIDNVYIRGNEKDYVSIKDLNVEDITVTKGSNNVFTLEWYWANDDLNDTFTGSQKETQYYTLTVEVGLNE